MTVLRIENFAGVAPRYSARLLPKNGATIASNAKLLSGELRGLHETQLLYDFNQNSPPHPVVRAFRLPATVSAPIPISGSDSWYGFYDPNVDFVRTPVLEDSFERYYWTGDSYRLSGAPQYNTRARINGYISSGSTPSFLLGIPTPINAPIVTPASGTNLVRAYVYTFVSAYGEEGPPSAPTTATGTNGTWTITGFDSNSGTYNNPVLSSANYNITTIRFYRTVAGATSTEYYHVGDVSVGTTSFSDSASDASVALNYTLPSLTWTGPPATLQGLVAHPGGFLVGFSGRDLWISEPYQPHAWPVQYIQTVQTEIVGIAIYNNCIIVMTTSHPYIANGMSPLSITLQKLDSIDPCVSRRSIATTLEGVYYASPQGIVKNDSTLSTLVTEQLFTREEWQEQFSPTTVYAAPYGLQYIAFDTSAAGFIFSPAEQLAPLTTLDRFSYVAAIQIDQYSGDVYLVQSSQVRLWDPPASIPYSYTWQSKEFDLPKPVNFGAFRLKFNSNPVSVSASQLADYTTFNNARIANPLSPLNWAAIGTARQTYEAAGGRLGLIPPANYQIKNPIGGSPLFNISALLTNSSAVQVYVKARDLSGNWNTQYTGTVSIEGTVRLPSGFKSDVWQVELIGNTNVYSFTMAETAKELNVA